MSALVAKAPPAKQLLALDGMLFQSGKKTPLCGDPEELLPLLVSKLGKHPTPATLHLVARVKNDLGDLAGAVRDLEAALKQVGRPKTPPQLDLTTATADGTTAPVLTASWAALRNRSSCASPRRHACANASDASSMRSPRRTSKTVCVATPPAWASSMGSSIAGRGGAKRFASHQRWAAAHVTTMARNARLASIVGCRCALGAMVQRLHCNFGPEPYFYAPPL